MKQETKSKKVFICSPYRPIGDTAEERERDLQQNRQLASLACGYATSNGYMPMAPHLFFPVFLSDDDPEEREKGIHLGLEWLEECDELWVVGNRITEGMKREICIADKLGIPMQHITFRRKDKNGEDQKKMTVENMKKESENKKIGETGENGNTNPVDQLKNAIANVVEEMEKELDKSFIESGKVLAQMFRTLCETALRLPNMELHTDLMRLSNTDDGLSVYFDRRKAENRDTDDYDEEFDDSDDYDADDYDADDADDFADFDEEEGMLYDED